MAVLVVLAQEEEVLAAFQEAEAEASAEGEPVVAGSEDSFTTYRKRGFKPLFYFSIYLL